MRFHFLYSILRIFSAVQARVSVVYNVPAVRPQIWIDTRSWAQHDYWLLEPHLGLVPVHAAPRGVPEVVEEGVVPPPGEGAGAVEARAHEHRVGQRGHQLVPVEAAVGGHLQHRLLIERATKEGSLRFTKCPEKAYTRHQGLLLVEIAY